MSKGENMKAIDFETRIALENISKVAIQGDMMVIIDAPMASWEYCSCAKFGKMIAKLNDAEKSELNSMSKDEMTALAKEAREYYENPSQG
jgi:hypothetical protein